jgi:predicted  nucleic acid-binding Zn-ribbon protein
MASDLQMIMQAIKELGTNFVSLDQKIDKLDKRIDKFEGRMDRIETRMDDMEQNMKSGFAALKQDIEAKHIDVLARIDLLHQDAANSALDMQCMKHRLKKAGI